MFLLELRADSVLILLACISVLAILLSWLADTALADAGFGIYGNFLFCAAGAYGGLYILDFALTYQYLPDQLSGITYWVFAGFLGAVALMIAATLTKVHVLKL